MQLNVLINMTRLVPASQGSGGAGWFSLFAAATLARLGNVVTILTVLSNEDYIRNSVPETTATNLLFEVVRTSLTTHLQNRTLIADVYFDPLNGLEPDLIPAYLATITTIHDLMFVKLPQVFTLEELRLRTHNYFTSMMRSDVVTTTCADEARNIGSLLGIDDVVVVPQPAYFNTNQKPWRSSSSGKAFYSPGVQWNHKNHFRAVYAFLDLLKRGRIPQETYLFLSGVVPVEANHFLTHELTGQSKHKDNVIFLDFMSAARYRTFISKLSGIIIPSLYEGYGIPLVEAVASGVPVLTSRSPSLQYLKEIPDFVSIIENPSDQSALTLALDNFINQNTKASPRPDLCPTDDDFGDALNKACLKACTKARARGTVVARNLASLVPDRRQDTTAVFALHDDPGSTEMVPTSLGSGTYKCIHISLGSQDDNIGICRRTSLPGQIQLAHELMLSSCRYIIICYAPDAQKLVPEYISQALTRLLSSSAARVDLDDLCAREVILDGRSLRDICGLYDLNRLDIPFELPSVEVVTRLRTAKRLIGGIIPRAIIIDPGLESNVGHHMSVATDICEGSFSHGYLPTVFGPVASKCTWVAGSEHFVKLFSGFLYGYVSDPNIFIKELETAIDDRGIIASDIIFAFCSTPTMLLGQMIWLLKRTPPYRPRIVIRFDRPHWLCPPSSFTYHQLFSAIGAFGLLDNFRFSVESLGLRSYFELESGHEFQVVLNTVDMSHASLISKAFSDDDSVTDTVHDYVVAYFGEAREEKGFHHLPVLVETVLYDSSFHKVRFRLQIGSNTWNDTDTIIASRKQLAALAKKFPNRVELLPGGLTTSLYNEAVRTSHVLLLPYDPRAYRIRGSGVAVEAAAFGIPFIASAGMDVVKTFKGRGVHASMDYSSVGLADALVGFLKSPPEPPQDADRDPNVELTQDATDFVARAIGNSTNSALSDLASQLVLWISNDTRGEGSDAVYRSQLAYLLSRGYFVIKVVVPYPAKWRIGEPDNSHLIREKVLGQEEIVLRFEESLELEEVIRRIELEGNSTRSFVDAWRFLKVPQELDEILRNAKPAFIIVNYAHHLSVARDLNYRHSPMLLEAHDIQSRQYAISSGREVRADEIAFEKSLVSAFNHVVSISASEAEFFADIVGEENVTWCMPFVSRPPVVSSQHSSDLMFVGSAHDANILSLKWFLHEVYAPYLYPAGLSFAIAGTAGAHVDVSLFSSFVHVLGRVEDLSPFYASTRLVVLPIVAGAGVPIKVLDALSSGRPYVLTDFPERAMQLPAAIQLARSAVEMGRQVLECLKSSDECEKRVSAGLDYVRENASANSYFSKWDLIINRVIHPGVPGRG